MTDEILLNINKETLTNIIKSNIGCHVNKPFTQDIIDTVTMQIVETIEYFLNKKEDNL